LQGKARRKVPAEKVDSKNKSRKLGVVIVAAGTSKRMVGMNKLFAPLSGKPLLAWSVDTCQRSSLVRQIVLVVNNKDLGRGQELKEERSWSKVVLCLGGARRQDSVKQGLRQVRSCDWVMIHDGARPFLTPDLIEKGSKMAAEFGAAVAAVPVKDTIKLADSRDLIKETLQRDRLWAAQTPQTFSLDIITKGYENLTTEVTDDAAAVERLGYKVHLYMGDNKNIKVTTPEDLALARIIAREWKRKN
jgi:2-C-methyl-D-erythritol 4-phosphate cytidylyltransferase